MQTDDTTLTDASEILEGAPQFSLDELMKALAYRERYNIIETVFPDKGKYRRTLYKKHMTHFEKGLTFKQRMFMAANRVGKTMGAGTELVYHLTGNYPHWWKGFRFDKPNDWWLAGKSIQTVREIFQPLLLGDVGDFGSGLIPKHLLDFSYMTKAKRGDTLVSTFRIMHKSGGWSTVVIKTYEAGRQSFEGAKVNIWLDEEPPLDIMQECLMRTMKTGDDEAKMLIMTFTPMKALTDTVLTFIGKDGNYTEGVKGPGKWLTGCTWDDVPHLSKEEKEELYQSIPEHLRDARTKGLPTLGAGQVYPFDEEKVFIEPIRIPEHWRRVYALDFGFSPDPTAILWAAIDPADDTIYIHAEHYVAEKPRAVHAQAIHGWNEHVGFPIPGVCDPSAGGTSKNDGTTEKYQYGTQHKVFLQSAKYEMLEPGIQSVFDKFVENKIKIFNTLQNTKAEFRLYRRDEKGKLRGADHLMDDLRYIVNTGTTIAKSYTQWNAEQFQANIDYSNRLSDEDSWHLRENAWQYR